MSDFVKVAATGDLEPGNGKVVEVGDVRVALFNVGGSYHAIDNTCPHAMGPLGEGDLEGTVVTCPWHMWQFDVVTGQCPHNPGMKVHTYPVRVEGEEVRVHLT